MPYSVGVDIIECRRIKAIRYLERFLDFVFTSHELEELDHHPNHIGFIASRFAVKEAVIKARKDMKLTFKDFEIVKDMHDRPFVRYHIPSPTNMNTQISLAHSEDYVAGFAVIFF